jgi:hypothetical protein
MPQAELGLERDVSAHIGRMPFLWLDVDEPGRLSDRSKIERSLVSLLSNCGKDAIDAASPDWLGRSADRAATRDSGLWNVDYVDQPYDASGLARLEARHRELNVG